MVKERVQRISYNQNLSLYMLPSTAKIEICGKCTYSCIFCYQTQMKQSNNRQKMMSVNDFDTVINFLQTIRSIKEVGLFYMGESGLHPNLALFYKRLKELNYFTYLTTNGSIYKNISKCIPYVDSLKISWNYIDKYDFAHKTGQSIQLYDKIISNINLLYKDCHLHGKQLAVSTVLDSDKNKYSNVLCMLKFDEHYFIPLQTQCGTISTGLGGVVGEADHIRSQLPCWSLFKGLYIDVDLNVRTCCYGHHDNHVCYNIKTQHDYLMPDKILKMRFEQLSNKIPSECISCITS